MAVEIVDLPIKDGDFPVRKLLVYQRVMVKTDGFPVSIFQNSKTHGFLNQQ